MRPIKYEIVASIRPDNLPSAESIVHSCGVAWAKAAGSTADLRGIALVGESQQPPCAWVKFGSSISMAEARTQHYVAQVINGSAGAAVRVPAVYLAFTCGNWAYVVMEFIDGNACRHADARLVADAVQSLVAIPAPADQTPGPVGGGLIRHDFFYGRESSVPYNSVNLLQLHVNGILAHEQREQRVDFGPEVVAHGLRLCLSDMNRHNFMKDRDGRIVALDFGATSFLPVSFFAHALCNADAFTQRLRRLIPQQSTQLNALMTASYCLIPYGSNMMGFPPQLPGGANYTLSLGRGVEERVPDSDASHFDPRSYAAS